MSQNRSKESREKAKASGWKPVTREIPLTRGYVAVVDESDYEWLMQWKWTASASEFKGKKRPVYAHRKIRRGGRQVTIWMHRLLTSPPDDMSVDHIDGNSLNNTRSNLRVVTHRENILNTKMWSHNTSGYRGAFFDKWTGRWKAGIKVDGKLINIGRYDTAEEAAKAYDAAARKYFADSEMFFLNFPEAE